MSDNEEGKVMDGYKAINTSGTPSKEFVPPVQEPESTEDEKRAPKEVTIEEVTEGEAVEIDLASGEVVEEKAKPKKKTKAKAKAKKEAVTPKEEEGDGSEEAPKKVSTPKQDKRPSRAKKRIKQLHTQVTEQEQRAVEAEAKIKELEAQIQQGSQESKESLKASLEANMVSTTKAMQEAIEDGNSEDAVRLSVETTNTQMKLAGLTSELQGIERQQEQAKAAPQPKPQQQTIDDVPEKALDWIDDHPQFKSDPLFHVSSMTVSNMLVDEGFDDQSDEFYAELTSRLSPRFPEVFGTDGENGVEYNQDDTNASDEDEDGNEEASQARDKTDTTQVVSGSSRTPPHKKGKGRGGKSVVLSPEMVKQAERWGLSLEQIARRVAHNESNTRDDGYVAINMKKS